MTAPNNKNTALIQVPIAERSRKPRPAHFSDTIDRLPSEDRDHGNGEGRDQRCEHSAIEFPLNVSSSLNRSENARAFFTMKPFPVQFRPKRPRTFFDREKSPKPRKPTAVPGGHLRG